MKVQVFLPLTIVLSALLVVLIRVRQEDKEKENKRGSFMDIKLRVSDDVLREYANEKLQLNQDIDTAKDEYKSTDEGRKASQEAADKATHEAGKCAEEQVRADGGQRAPGTAKCLRSGKCWPTQRENLPLTQRWFRAKGLCVCLFVFKPYWMGETFLNVLP